MTTPLTDKTFELRFNGGATCITDEEGRIVAYSKNEQAQDALIASPDMARALLPLARFVEAWDSKPMRGIDDVLYGIHGGEGMPHGADIRLSDLRKALAALRKAKVLP